MQDSRLEKFIYAICSMEVSDLPAPLSRIETLWNCLITGETPDFKPLSRNEYYLMAMIGMYGVEELPTPLSRGEKLLYKIAMGDSELSDIPAYLSRYEELLGYLVENGGVGNFEYVLYTLNERVSTLYLTVEKPMKQAVFKGDTLVNDLPKPSLKNEMRSIGSQKLNNGYDNVNVVDGKFKSAILKGSTKLVSENGQEFDNYFTIHDKLVTGKGINDGDGNLINSSNDVSAEEFLPLPQPPFIITGNSRWKKIVYYDSDKQFISSVRHETRDIPISSIPSNAKYCRFGYANTVKDDTFKLVNNDGSELDYPKLTMQSVKMPVLKATGKNLLDPNYLKEQCLKISSSATYTDGNIVFNSKDFHEKRLIALDFEPNTRYAFNLKMSGQPNSQLHIKVHYTDSTATFHTPYIADWTGIISDATKANATVDYITISYGNGAAGCVLYVDECSLFKSDTVMPHEPYKSNILSTSEEVTLRGIGDVQDTLDCLTGQVTQRFNEIVIDGTIESIINIHQPSNSELLTFRLDNVANDGIIDIQSMSDKLLWNNTPGFLNYPYSFRLAPYGNPSMVRLFICLPKSILSEESANGLMEWLANNPVKIQYPLATPVVKTVDLTTIDQDGTSQEAFHSFNNGILNVSSQGLLPIIKYEVPTNNSYYLPDKLALNTLYTSRGSLPSTAIIDGQTLTLSTNGTFTTPSSITNNLMVLSDVVDNLMFILGDQTAKEFGYFEGMQSVKMPVLTTYGDNIFDNDNIIVGSYYNYDGNFSYHATSVLSTTYISIEPDAQLISNISRSSYQIIEYDSNKNFITRQNAIPNIPATLSSNTRYVRFSFYDCGVDFDCYIRKGTIKPLVYEPYKSNILSTPEDVELRGIGEVKDELDLMTGEMTQRIESLILDGINHKLTKTTYEAGRRRFDTDVTNLKIIGNGWVRTELVATSDKLIPCDFYTAVKTMSPCLIAWKNMLAITLEDESIDTVDKANNYLQNNPIEIQYVLDTPVHKTVDLSIVDQDGQPTKLKTFDDVTHVSIQVNDITPEVALEVSTKIEKALMATPSNEDDILNEQSRLIETVKKQTEDADATMMATTEIYEQIL